MYKDQQNLPFSQQNILANSIRIARQRISKNAQGFKYQHNQIQKDKQNQTFSFVKQKKQSSAAQAIKVLHNKIAQLQAFNSTLTKQNSTMRKQINLKNLQIQTLKAQHNNYQRKYIENSQKLIRVEKQLKNKQAQMNQIKRRKQQKDQEYTLLLVQKQKIISQSQLTIQMLQKKVEDLKKRIDNNQRLVVQMIKQLEEQRIKNSNVVHSNINFNSPNGAENKSQQRNKYSKSSKSKQLDIFPVIVDEGQREKDSKLLSKIESSKKIRSIRQSCQPKRTQTKGNDLKKVNKNLQTQYKQLKQKNQQLFTMLKSSDRKFKQQQRSKLQYKNKFYSLKEVIDSIIQQINRLPNNLSHKFKCLMVKVKKIQTDNLQCLRSHSTFYRNNRFRSKSSGNSSKINSSNSKSKQKQLKMSDLSLSDNQMQLQKNYRQQRSHSKSKKRSTSNIQGNSGNKKYRQNNQHNNSHQVIKALNKKIRQQRKELYSINKRIGLEQDKHIQDQLRNQFDQKMNINIGLVNQLQAYKKQNI